MQSCLILLNATTNNTWFLILLPTIIMLCSLPLWAVKRLHNVFFNVLISIGFFGWIAIIFLASATSRDSVTSPGIFGGILLAIVILLANAFQYLLYRRLLNNNRCPNCHSLGLKRLSKEVETLTNSNTTVYSVSGGKYDGKKYDRVVDHIHKYTTYTNYCSVCNSVIVWTEESEDKLVSDERPEEIRNK